MGGDVALFTLRLVYYRPHLGGRWSELAASGLCDAAVHPHRDPTKERSSTSGLTTASPEVILLFEDVPTIEK